MTRTEIPLQGGNASGGVVRIGDTVRRPAGPWTPTVHALLGHLHEAGFPGAPRPLGLDEHGREVLTFIPGTIPWPNNFHLLDPDGRLRRVARLIRDFHDAVTGFCPPPDPRWQALIPAEGTGIIAHHDLAPWNLVISPRQWAFIDWDTAAPGSRLWDVAYALHGFVPLSANPRYQRGNPAHRMRLFADAYGLDQAQRQELIPMLARRTKAMHDFLAEQAARGNQPWTRLWHEGHGRAWGTDTEYIARREGTWHRALLG
jgi:Phosphotransferase enzyme family